MPIQFLPGGDVKAGRRFNIFADEFAYAMGADVDFQKVELLKPDTIVINLLCFDPGQFAIPNGVSHKRSSREFWTSFNVDFIAFTSSDLEASIAAVKDGLIGAVHQIPSSRMTDEVKLKLAQAAEVAASRLASEPDRLTR